MKEIIDIVEAWRRAEAAGLRSALATVVHVEGSSYRRPGARMLVNEDGHFTGAISGGCLEGDALRKALHAIAQGRNRLVVYDTTDENDASLGVQLGCNGVVRILFEPLMPGRMHALHLLEAACSRRRESVLVTLFDLHPGAVQIGTVGLHAAEQETLPITHDKPDLRVGAEQALRSGRSLFREPAGEGQPSVFFDVLKPPVCLIFGGAGNDVMPLARMAATLGWQLTVIDDRPSHATSTRFPEAKRWIVASPEAAFERLDVDARTAIVLMSHNYRYDLAMLRQAVATECFYIGLLGPRQKLDRILEEGPLSAEANEKLHSPVGLDLGAETAEEIALSILAEIQARLGGTQAGFLRERAAPIHNRAQRYAA